MDIQNKKESYMILSCIISEKVVLEKGRVATTPFSIPVQVLINTSKVLEGSENKKEVENDLLSIMAPLNDERCSYKKINSILSSSVICHSSHP